MKNVRLLTLMLFIAVSAVAQSSKDKEIISDSQEAKGSFTKQDPSLGNLFVKAYAYAIFPNVGKGGLGIGGAAGNGAAYEKGKLVGMAKLKQVTIGLQAGGQGYREVIFFENAESFKKFKENNVEFSAQVSAVAATAGASANAKYNEGVMVFTMQKGGLMYEASVGGQKFKFSKL
jgi:lipid-binding SYLF domain-containing protein